MPQDTASLADQVCARFADRSAVVGVIGLGYVGLPLCLATAERGFRVVGFDIDPAKVDLLTAGESYFRHIAPDRIAAAGRAGRFTATSDLARLADADAVILCVPTPLTRQREPDLSFVRSTAESVSAHLRRGHLVVLESTTYPGTTHEVVRPILERTGLRSGRDFFLAYSPEREDPGNADFATSDIPRVVGAHGADAQRAAESLYGAIVARTVGVSTLATAEAVKLTENIFRAVNIALVNELKVVFDAMGIDVWEVIEAAKTKPFGYMPFYPGPGLGGHCIPIDPFYLTWKAREFGIVTRFIELAGEVNTAMPSRVVDRVVESLSAHSGLAVRGARILILGLAYKKNVDDLRESPAFKIIELLARRGATVTFYDPFVRKVPSTREHPNVPASVLPTWSAAALGEFDAAVICTDHDEVDYEMLAQSSQLIVDTRNVCARRGISGTHIVKA